MPGTSQADTGRIRRSSLGIRERAASRITEDLSDDGLSRIAHLLQEESAAGDLSISSTPLVQGILTSVSSEDEDKRGEDLSVASVSGHTPSNLALGHDNGWLSVIATNRGAHRTPTA
jgi:hypothetical protein